MMTGIQAEKNDGVNRKSVPLNSFFRLPGRSPGPPTTNPEGIVPLLADCNRNISRRGGPSGKEPALTG
jgi:hypothetical protein